VHGATRQSPYSFLGRKFCDDDTVTPKSISEIDLISFAEDLQEKFKDLQAMSLVEFIVKQKKYLIVTV
jgi:hypothetical protein